MEAVSERYDALLRAGAKRLCGHQRRLFMAEVTLQLCGGNARQAERRFGWGRETVKKGLHELQQGIRCVENFTARARGRCEEDNPQLAADIRAIVEPRTQADPELKSERRYTNLTAHLSRKLSEPIPYSLPAQYRVLMTGLPIPRYAAALLAGLTHTSANHHLQSHAST
jgi:hypothetical protein